jgi:hypothetical protein
MGGKKTDSGAVVPHVVCMRGFALREKCLAQGRLGCGTPSAAILV